MVFEYTVLSLLRPRPLELHSTPQTDWELIVGPPLSMGARRGLLDLADAFEQLKRTSFHYRQEIMDQYLNEHFGEAGAGNR